VRAVRRERLKQRYTLSLLSFVSKQMSTRLFSLLQHKGLLTHTHTHTHTGMHTHIILDKSMHSGFSNFPRCFALHPPRVSEVTKPARDERISYFLPSFSLNLFPLVCLFSLLYCFQPTCLPFFFFPHFMYIYTKCNVLPN